jgi:serine/threonine-protein kinase HipA
VSDILSVSLQFSAERVARVGRLANDALGIALLEYGPEFIASGLTLNPVRPKPSNELVRSGNPRDTENLPGFIADSLPDAWGRLLVERRLGRRVRAGFELLEIVGRRGRGALVYEPAKADDEERAFAVDFDELAAGAEAVLAGEAGNVISKLAVLGGSSGGARPKVNVALDGAGNAVVPCTPLPAGFTEWIVKFPSSADEIPDAGILEAAYARAAKNAGIDMPSTRLIDSPAGRPPYYAIERFDRTPSGGRLHMLSAAGALEADWSIPSVTYENLFRVTRLITRSDVDVREMFRRMVFNVLAHNRDDHAKQHSFLMRADGRWRLSPAYDLTFSRGPGGEHYAAVNGKGSEISRSDLLAEAGEQSISRSDAIAMIERVAAAVHEIPALARELGCSRATARELKTTLEGERAAPGSG